MEGNARPAPAITYISITRPSSVDGIITNTFLYLMYMMEGDARPAPAIYSISIAWPNAIDDLIKPYLL